MKPTPFNLPDPTICDMNCFKAPGHEGPCTKWLGDSCDRCEEPAQWRSPNGGAVCSAHRRRRST